MLHLNTNTANFYKATPYRFACFIEGVIEFNCGIPASDSNQLIVRVHYDAVEWMPSGYNHSRTHSNSSGGSTTKLNRVSSSLITIITTTKPGIERVQAITDILHWTLCCHSNETRAPIANPPNSEQLGAPLLFLQVTSGSVHQCGHAATDRHTDACDQYTFCLSCASDKM